MAATTTVIYHPRYREYFFGPSHPFNPIRLDLVWSLIDGLDAPREVVAPPVASVDEILSVHAPDLVACVMEASGGTAPPAAQRFGLNTPDVPVFEGMHAAACGLVGGALHAARMVAAGDTKRALHLGGGLHHAHRDRAAGFCVYNDLGVAIRALRDQGLRVAYVDVDVHHGDGVQALFYDDPGVLTISLHESGLFLYPGTGAVTELGSGAGKGTALNVPLQPHTDGASFAEVFEAVVPHALSWYQPDVVVAQCGADAHRRDPLADLLLTTRTYETVFRRLIDVAGECAGGRAVFTLGGGYDFDPTARVWSILYLLLHNHPLPDLLPPDIQTIWEQRLGHAVERAFHDPKEVDRSDRSLRAAEKNRSTARRLMERAVKYWR